MKVKSQQSLDDHLLEIRKLEQEKLVRSPLIREIAEVCLHHRASGAELNRWLGKNRIFAPAHKVVPRLLDFSRIA